jgi:hypothetical protein
VSNNGSFMAKISMFYFFSCGSFFFFFHKSFTSQSINCSLSSDTFDQQTDELLLAVLVGARLKAWRKGR